MYKEVASFKRSHANKVYVTIVSKEVVQQE